MMDGPLGVGILLQAPSWLTSLFLIEGSSIGEAAPAMVVIG
jgi:hypothetical protein